MFLNKALCILGPTCVGKTNLSINLSNIIPIEIISLDSTMLYKKMDIGSDKPSFIILNKIKHNLINIIDPKETYSVHKFCEDVINILNNSWNKNKLPVFVGGNLMYIWILQNLFLKKYNKNNLIKINTNKIEFINIAILPKDKKILKKNIEKRLDNMIKIGLINEVEYLYKRGDLNINLNSIKSIGYKDFWLYIDNKIPFNLAKETIIKSTIELSNKQVLWLKNWGVNIIYLDSRKKNLIKVYNLINKYFLYY